MKRFKLDIRDKCGAEVYEGSILGIVTTRRKGYQKAGEVIKRKVVFGKANTDANILTDYIGFWAVDMDCKDTSEDGVNSYEIVTSVQYLISSNGAEVIGSVYEELDT